LVPQLGDDNPDDVDKEEKVDTESSDHGNYQDIDD